MCQHTPQFAGCFRFRTRCKNETAPRCKNETAPRCKNETAPNYAPKLTPDFRRFPAHTAPRARIRTDTDEATAMGTETTLPEKGDLTPIQAAELCGGTAETIRKAIRAGLLRAYKVGRWTLRIRPADLRDYCPDYEPAEPEPDGPPPRRPRRSDDDQESL